MKLEMTGPRLPLLWQQAPPQSASLAILGKMKWSYSRRNVLEQCPRRYYYEYYGSAARRGTQGPDAVKLRFLKSLQNRHERIGSIAHSLIAAYLKKARSGEVWSADRLGAWARDIFRKDVSHSKLHPNGNVLGSGRFPPTLLQEYYYRNPDAPTLCFDAAKRLAEALHTFRASSHFAELRSAGTRPNALVEHNLTLSGLPCRASGKLDLAFAEGGSVTVVDWKLGGPSGSADESLQLATYALWASQHFAALPKAIAVYQAYLTADEIVRFPVTERVLINTRARIIQDGERMAVLDDYGRRGLVEAFTPCAQPNVCVLCPFQEVCPEGRSALHA